MVINMKNEFGRKLRELRLQRAMTLRDLATRAKLSYSFIGSLENGRFNPSRESIMALSKALDADTNALLILGGFVPSDPKKSPIEDISIDSVEREFISWIKNNIGENFLYDFARSPEDTKKFIMETLRMVWEREKGRNPT